MRRRRGCGRWEELADGGGFLKNDVFPLAGVGIRFLEQSEGDGEAGVGECVCGALSTTILFAMLAVRLLSLLNMNFAG